MVKFKVVVKRHYINGCRMDVEFYSIERIRYVMRSINKFIYPILDRIESKYLTFIANHTKFGRSKYLVKVEEIKDAQLALGIETDWSNVIFTHEINK